jgi:hypothetical protein
MRRNDHGWRADLIQRNISRATRSIPHCWKHLDLRVTKKLPLPLVAFSAGSLSGGARLHLLPEAVAAGGPGLGTGAR